MVTKFGCSIVTRHFAIMRLWNMLKICLVLWKSEPHYSGCRKTLTFRVWFASSWARESTFHFTSSSDHVFRQEIMSTDLWFNIQSIDRICCVRGAQRFTFSQTKLFLVKPNCRQSMRIHRLNLSHKRLTAKRVRIMYRRPWHDHYQWLKSINLFHSF